MSTATATPAVTIDERQDAAGLLDEAIAQTYHRKNIEQRAAAFLGVSPDNVCDLLRNVWTPSKGKAPYTKQEMFTGLSLIARYQLDPISREVYLGRGKDDRLMTIIGVDGIIKILDRTDHYDGFEQDYGWDEQGEMEWCETKIYSKKRSKPSVYRAFKKEYARLGGFMLPKIPWHMLRLFSLRHAARMFTPLGGIVTEEEAKWMSGAAETATSSTLDDLASRAQRPPRQRADFKQAVEQPGGETQETHQADTSPPSDEPHGLQLLDEYTTLINDTETLGSNGGCNEIEKAAHASLKDGDITDAQQREIMNLLGVRRAEIRSGRGSRSD